MRRRTGRTDEPPPATQATDLTNVFIRGGGVQTLQLADVQRPVHRRCEADIRSVVTLRMQNGTSQSPFCPRLSRQPIVPRPPCVRAASPHPRKLGASYAALPQMARRRVGCACICSPPATGPGAPSPLRPYARAYAYRGLGAADKAAIQLVKVQPCQLLVTDT